VLSTAVFIVTVATRGHSTVTGLIHMNLSLPYKVILTFIHKLIAQDHYCELLTFKQHFSLGLYFVATQMNSNRIGNIDIDIPNDLTAKS